MLANRKALPPALRVMIQLISESGYRTSAERPKDHSGVFIRVERVGGSQDDLGRITEPLFAVQTYARSVGDCERVCEELLVLLRNAEFTVRDGVQIRKWSLVGAPTDFPDPDLGDWRRWQFSGTLGMSHYERNDNG